MVTRKKVGAGLLATSALLLGLQFVLAFNTSALPTDRSISTLLFHLTPYSLLLVSIYLVFGRSMLPQRGVARGVIVLAASYGLAGGAFLLLVIAGLVLKGSEAISFLFSQLPWFIAVGTVFALPLVNRLLR